MLSSRLDDSVRASEIKLLKKEKKKLAKVSLEEAEVESCTPSDINSDDKVNKYINVINKKLRTLRKRMNKIEKYENCNNNELNADQIVAIKKKPEVSALLKEFEDLHKQYTAFDEQEQKEHETNKKLQEERLIKEINENVENEKKLFSSKLHYLFKATYALNIVINTRKFTFSNAELNALNYIRNVLLGANDVINENNHNFEGEIILDKLYEASTDECCDNVTFKDVNNLIHLILNPPQVSKKDSCQGLSFFSQDTSIDFKEHHQTPQQMIFVSNNSSDKISPSNAINEVSVSMSKINFMQPNECIDEEEEKNDQNNTIDMEKKEILIEETQALSTDKNNAEITTININKENNETNLEETELGTEETQTAVTEVKKSSEQPYHTGYQNNQSNNQFQKKRGYYKNGRGRRGYQNGQYNNRHGNGNGYKGSRNNGYYPHQNQNYASYYYNNRSATF